MGGAAEDGAAPPAAAEATANSVESPRAATVVEGGSRRHKNVGPTRPRAQHEEGRGLGDSGTRGGSRRGASPANGRRRRLSLPPTRLRNRRRRPPTTQRPPLHQRVPQGLPHSGIPATHGGMGACSSAPPGRGPARSGGGDSARPLRRPQRRPTAAPDGGSHAARNATGRPRAGGSAHVL